MSAARTVGIALGAGRGVVAWWPGAVASLASAARARTAQFTFDADALALGDASSLNDALHEVRAQMVAGDATAGRPGTAHGAAEPLRAFVALASPFTAPRELSLPPMRVNEARAVLERDAARWFPRRRAEPVVAVRALTRGAPATYLGAEADGVVLEAVRRAAEQLGGELVEIAPAMGAWARASGSAQQAVFVLDGEATVLATRDGVVTRLRRCRAEDVGAGASLGAPAVQSGMTSRATIESAADPLETAARFAPWNREREFVHPAVRARRRTAASRVTRRLSTVAAAFVLVAGAAWWWGAAREARVIAAERAALEPALTVAMAQRDSVVAIEEQLDALDRAERASPAWSARLWTIVAALPADAYLTAARGAGDSLQVEGRAVSAAKVFNALRAVRGVEGVRATAPIRVDDGPGLTHEAFSIAVRLRAPGAGGK
ncbi:MAG: hypothetical protein HY084_04950 [Gemmatimonadetes bacterium]|nr:hypothetical protein [Gemmatimonadota bacterium]